MKTLINTKGIANKGKIKSGLAEISMSGFKNIQLDICSLGSNTSEWGIDTVVSVCKRENINISAVRVSAKSIEKAMNAIEICGKINCRYIVVSPASAESYKENMNFYMSLGQIAVENNVTILIENSCRNFNGHNIRGFFCEYDVTADFLDKLNSVYECFGLCCDIGGLKLCGIDMKEYILNLADYIKIVRIRENNGQENYSGMLFTGHNNEWSRAAAGLRKIQYNNMLLFDIEDTYYKFPPMYSLNLLKLAKEISGYFEWEIKFENVLKKYSHIVIFGAKNMLRNYMMDYGEKYPPLFVCDNNKNIWGEKKFGVEVCSPEKLYGIPESCGIIICSVYYKEIKEQLMDMGMKNIEYFYDEC